MERIKALNINEVSGILDFVHDRFFQISEIQYQENLKTLIIPISVISPEKTKQKSFFCVQTWKNPIRQAQLVFNGVMEYTVKDEAKTGEADINTILQDGEWLRIKCGMPVEIRMKITEFNIELKFLDTIISEKPGFALGFVRYN